MEFFKKRLAVKQTGVDTEGRNVYSTVTDDELMRAFIQANQDAVKTGEILGLSDSQVRRRVRRIRLAGSGDRPTLLEREDPDKKNRLEKLLSDGSIDVDAVGRLAYLDVGSYGMGHKDKEGVWHDHPLYRASARLIPPAPTFPIGPAGPTTIIFNEAPRILRAVKTTPVLSDTQTGFLLDLDTQLMEPTHDPQAMEVARQIIAATASTTDTVVHIGDMMDYAIFGRWQKRPEYFGVTNAGNQAGHDWLARWRAAGRSDARFIMVGSNHQMRPETFLLEYNMLALGVKRAQVEDCPEPWPIFSEPFMLRYDELGIEFSGQYPGGEFWLLPDLVFVHAPPKKAEFAANVIHGHTHKIETSPHVLHSHAGRIETLTHDCGCLCQTGATINQKRLLITKVPSDRPRTNWLQGMVVVEYIEGKIPKHQVTQIRIKDGQAIFQGQEFDASGFVDKTGEEYARRDNHTEIVSR